VTNGTTAGTHEIALDGASSVGNLTVFNHDVLFSALDASNNLGLWITDGTTAGTHEITVNGAIRLESIRTTLRSSMARCCSVV
jgi:hypothetical protein